MIKKATFTFAPINRHSKTNLFHPFLHAAKQKKKINKILNPVIRIGNQCKVTMRASSPTEKERPVSQPGSDPISAYFFVFYFTFLPLRVKD